MRLPGVTERSFNEEGTTKPSILLILDNRTGYGAFRPHDRLAQGKIACGCLSGSSNDQLHVVYDLSVA
jgi:hypothetical protein